MVSYFNTFPYEQVDVFILDGLVHLDARDIHIDGLSEVN